MKRQMLLVAVAFGLTVSATNVLAGTVPKPEPPDPCVTLKTAPPDPCSLGGAVIAVLSLFPFS